jgi:superfamily II DNA or RNA helicase
VGGMTQEQLSQSESKQIILATYQMSSEGMDIPVLNTLILASPISSIEQSIGRIQRQKEHEREYIPMTIDIWDRFSLFQRQGIKRMEFYAKQGYVIENTGGIPVALSMAQEIKEKESQKMCYRDDDDNDV